MNRELKFRVWDVKSKHMIDLDRWPRFGFINPAKENTKSCQGAGELLLTTNPEWYEWMQFTGLKDRKGKEIFEGDIYFTEEEYDSGDLRELYIVVWIKEWARFSFLHLPGEYMDYVDNGIEHFDHAMRESYVIDLDELKNMHFKGNMYEQPELLSYKGSALIEADDDDE